jgi:hypothetical protein
MARKQAIAARAGPVRNGAVPHSRTKTAGGACSAGRFIALARCARATLLVVALDL